MATVRNHKIAEAPKDGNFRQCVILTAEGSNSRTISKENLLEAVKSGKADELQTFIRLCYNSSHIVKWYEEALKLAIYLKDINVCKKLIASPNDLVKINTCREDHHVINQLRSVANRFAATPFLLVSRIQEEAIITSCDDPLIKRLWFTQTAWFELLRMAISLNFYESIHLLIRHYTDIERRKRLYFALSSAVIEGKLELCQKLIDDPFLWRPGLNIDLNAKLPFPLEYTKFPRLRRPEEVCKLTLVDLAVMADSLGILKLLAVRGADLNLIRDRRSTIFHMAAWHCSINVIKYLRTTCSDLYWKKEHAMLLHNLGQGLQGEQPGIKERYTAFISEMTKLDRKIIDRPVRDPVNRWLWETPLHRAVRVGNSQFADALIDCGARSLNPGEIFSISILNLNSKRFPEIFTLPGKYKNGEYNPGATEAEYAEYIFRWFFTVALTSKVEVANINKIKKENFKFLITSRGINQDDFSTLLKSILFASKKKAHVFPRTHGVDIKHTVVQTMLSFVEVLTDPVFLKKNNLTVSYEHFNDFFSMIQKNYRWHADPLTKGLLTKVAEKLYGALFPEKGITNDNYKCVLFTHNGIYIKKWHKLCNLAFINMLLHQHINFTVLLKKIEKRRSKGYIENAKRIQQMGTIITRCKEYALLDRTVSGIVLKVNGNVLPYLGYADVSSLFFTKNYSKKAKDNEKAKDNKTDKTKRQRGPRDTHEVKHSSAGSASRCQR